MLDMIKKSLSEFGYVFLPKYKCASTIEDVAKEIGDVFFISKVLPNTTIPDIQLLRPRDKCASLNNQYSGVFGFGDFPFHSDLAHWKFPPRYILLRCIKGSSDVATPLISSNSIIEHFGQNYLKKAIFRTRRRSVNSSPTLLPLLFKSDGIYGLRWDSLFLIPMNSSASAVKVYLNALSPEAFQEKSFFLSDMGDSLLIDNWKMLHGRSSVPPASRSRIIERIYLANIRE